MTSVLHRSAGAAVHWSQPRIRSGWQRAVIRRGRDATAEYDRRRSLVLAPHPDDETLGCGAAIARKVAAGTEVRVLIAADGRYAQKASSVMTPLELRDVRASEAVAAVMALGLEATSLRQLGHEDTRLRARLSELTDVLEDEVRTFRPDEVLLPSALDHHPDHRTLNHAAHEALRRVGFSGHVAEFPVWFWADGPWVDLSTRPRAARLLHFLAAPFSATSGHRVELVDAGPVLERKRAALAAHMSQTTNLTGEAVWEVMDEEFLAPFLQRYEVYFVPSSTHER